MNDQFDSNKQITAAEPSRSVVIPAADFGVTLPAASFFADLDIQDPTQLYTTMQKLLSNAHGRVESFLTTPGAELTALDTPVADQIITENDLKTLQQMTSIIETHDQDFSEKVDSLVRQLEDMRSTLSHYDNTDISTSDLKTLKIHVPKILLSLRSLSMYAQDQFGVIPEDIQVNEMLARTASFGASCLNGAVPRDILEGTPETAIDFITQYGPYLSSLAEEMRMLCNPMIRFDSTHGFDLFSSTHHMLIASDGIADTDSRASLHDFAMLRKAGSYFEPARVGFVKEFKPRI